MAGEKVFSLEPFMILKRNFFWKILLSFRLSDSNWYKLIIKWYHPLNHCIIVSVTQSCLNHASRILRVEEGLITKEREDFSRRRLSQETYYHHSSFCLIILIIIIIQENSSDASLNLLNFFHSDIIDTIILGLHPLLSGRCIQSTSTSS